MKRISVAMAVYNGKKYLPEQLDSILKQLEKDDEILISYDPSNDGTWELLESYSNKYPQIRVVENKNHGITGNFNNALLNCTGDYIFICDQDDRWADNKRKVVVEAFKRTNADMVIHNGVHINCDGEVISDPFFSLYRIGNGKIRNILKPRYSGCCTAFTADMAKKILPMPLEIEAYDHWIGTVGEFMGKIAYEDSILLYHRLHTNNVTPTSARSLSVILDSRLKLVKQLVKRINRERRG